MLEMLLDNLDVIAEAPKGVQKVREMILQLAVRGKLVPQNPADEPTDLLLQRIETRCHSARAAATTEDVPFAIPKSWSWVRLGAIANLRLGKMLDKAKNRGQLYPYLRNTNVQWLRFDLSDVKEMRFEDAELDEFTLRDGDLILCEGGEPGRGAVWRDHGSRMMFQKALHRVRPLEGIVSAFILDYIQASAQSGDLEKCFTGATIKHMTGQSLDRLLIPLPPVPEQHRIVERVDELMALCDQLEERQRRRSALRVRANRSVLHHLTESRDDKEFAAKWNRLRENFHLLYDTPETVTELRQAVLQLAVRGGLTRGEARRHAPSSVVGNFVVFQNGYAFKSEWFTESGVRLVRNVNVGHGQLNWREAAFLSPDRASEFERFSLGIGDIVLSLDRPLISSGLKAARISAVDVPALLLQRVARAQFVGDVDPDYFYMWLQSPEFTDSIDPGRSNGVPHVSTKQVEQLPFAPPSIDEQRHVVAKVRELMALCDDLEVNLKEARQHATHLVVSVMNCLRAA